MDRFRGYREIFVFDFEYVSDDGEIPEPVCFVAVELRTGEVTRLWRDEMIGGTPLPVDATALWVCFSGVGDIGCFLELGWEMPARLVDLYPECRMRFYDSEEYVNPSLISACKQWDIPTMTSETKDAARDMIIHRLFSDDDRDYLLTYCEEDVHLTGRLFRAMYPAMTADVPTWQGCLLRGRYTIALARVEANGIPLDMKSLGLVLKHWETVKREIVQRIDTGGVYDGTSFKEVRFAALLESLDIAWPRLETGNLNLDDDVFRKMATIHGGVISNLREVRYALSKMRLSSYLIGKDGRNRVYLNPYGSVTGRNQPSNSRFIFGSARWVREFIQAPPGRGVVYVDWSSQEIAIAAALSGDKNLWDDYSAGDIYIAFAIRAGLAPAGATKQSHPAERKMCKAVVLGLSYGLTEYGLAHNLGKRKREARELIQLHKEAYSVFHKWADNQANLCSMGLPIKTRLGWTRKINPGGRVNLRSFKNFQMQATGAEMMRLAVSQLTEAGIRVCCPVHDAVLCEYDIATRERDIAAIMQIMGDVSELLLGDGYRVRAPVDYGEWEDGEFKLGDVFDHPACYQDESAGSMYRTVMEIAEEAEDLELRGQLNGRANLLSCS